MCYGNGCNDMRVSCGSALMIHHDNGKALGLRYWNRMKQRGETVLVEEVNGDAIPSANVVDLKVQRDEIEESGNTVPFDHIRWRRVVVCFDFDDPHTLLNTPPIKNVEKSEAFLDAFHSQLMY